jgi:S-(hydroxymethyl)glutathione dehydrogenase / alcohol dehydrogenase
MVLVRASLVLKTGDPFMTHDVEMDAPQAREVVVDVRASGLCHSDLLMAQHDLGYTKPVLLGHEVAGIVAETGPGVRSVTVGDHVVGCLIQHCGECASCARGRVLQCEQPWATLRPRDARPRLTVDGKAVTQGFGLGGFAERVLVHENQLTTVPTSVPFAQAAVLGCGVITGVGTVLNAADVQPGDTVVVIGTGGVGLNAISGAVLAQAGRIIAIDVSDDKLEVARRFGATDTVNSSATDPVAAVKQLARRGADAVFDFVGADLVPAQGLAMTRTGGGLYLVGILDPDAELHLRTYALVNSQKRVQGVAMGASVPRRDIARLAQLYLDGRLELDELVSRQIGLDQVDAGWAMLREPGVARIVVTAF